MNIKALILAIIAAVFVATVGVYLLTSSEQRNTDLTRIEQTTPAEPTNTVQDAAGVTQMQLMAGYRAKQAEFESQNPEYPDSEKIVYSIDADGLSDPELHPADAELLDLIKTLAPSNQVFDMIREFEVYFDEEDDTLASVGSLTDTNDQWVFSINYVAVTEFSDLAPTIVHEFAHILALQDSQTTTEAEQVGITESCTGYSIEEGCLTNPSYLNAFYAKFWQGSPDFQATDRSFDETDALIAVKPDNYVSSYAATNPVEDFAESFMHYTLEEPVTGDTIKAQKTTFFSSYVELSGYKKQVRSSIHGWAN